MISAIPCNNCGDDVMTSSDNPIKDDNDDIFCCEDCIEISYGCPIEEIPHQEVSVDEIINKYN